MTDTWAAKVLDGVPRYQTLGGNLLPEADALAAIAKLGAGDGLVERLLSWDGCWPAPWIERALPEAAARIAALTEQNQTWQRNSRETFDAMVAMRNSINEHLPMPSLESDLLQGPENSVFCAAVADAVVQHVAALTAQVAENRISEPHDPGDFVGDIYFGHPVKTTMGTHRWTGSEWVKLPSETEALMGLLADARSERDALRAKVARLEAAVMWARDRIAVDSGMTKAETKRTADELLNVLRGKPSPASDYAPEKWQFLTRAAVTDRGSEYERKVAQMKKDFPNGI